MDIVDHEVPFSRPDCIRFCLQSLQLGCHAVRDFLTRRYVVAISAAILPLSCLSLSGQTVVTKAIQFNAGWRHPIDSEEQQGFIYGYTDCCQALHDPLVSVDEEQSFVDKVVSSQEAGKKGPVISAMGTAWRTLRSKPIPKGEKLFSGPHGYLDGKWWGGFTGPWPAYVADADRGYLEGYLQCAVPPVTSKAVRTYQRAVNRSCATGHGHDNVAVVLDFLIRQYASAGQGK